MPIKFCLSRQLKRVLQILVGLPLLYLAPVNVLLNTGALEAVINQKPK